MEYLCLFVVTLLSVLVVAPEVLCAPVMENEFREDLQYAKDSESILSILDKIAHNRNDDSTGKVLLRQKRKSPPYIVTQNGTLVTVNFIQPFTQEFLNSVVTVIVALMIDERILFLYESRFVCCVKIENSIPEAVESSVCNVNITTTSTTVATTVTTAATATTPTDVICILPAKPTTMSTQQISHVTDGSVSTTESTFNETAETSSEPVFTTTDDGSTEGSSDPTTATEGSSDPTTTTVDAQTTTAEIDSTITTMMDTQTTAVETESTKESTIMTLMNTTFLQTESTDKVTSTESDRASTLSDTSTEQASTTNEPPMTQSTSSVTEKITETTSKTFGTTSSGTADTVDVTSTAAENMTVNTNTQPAGPGGGVLETTSTAERPSDGVIFGAVIGAVAGIILLAVTVVGVMKYRGSICFSYKRSEKYNLESNELEDMSSEVPN